MNVGQWRGKQSWSRRYRPTESHVSANPYRDLLFRLVLLGGSCRQGYHVDLILQRKWPKTRMAPRVELSAIGLDWLLHGNLGNCPGHGCYIRQMPLAGQPTSRCGPDKFRLSKPSHLETKRAGTLPRNGVSDRGWLLGDEGHSANTGYIWRQEIGKSRLCRASYKQAGPPGRDKASRIILARSLS